MKKTRLIVVALAFVGLFAGSAHAATISLLGDADCFGLGGSCPDGTRWRDDLGGVFFTSNQTGGDPAFTDIWAVPGSVSYTHTYALGGAVSAALELRIAGIHDINQSTTYSLLFNGTSIGAIAPHVGANNFQEVLTYLFAVPLGLLTGSDTVVFGGLGGDGFSIDYSKLTIQTAAAAVPEPGTLLLIGSGLLIARVRQRRRK